MIELFKVFQFKVSNLYAKLCLSLTISSLRFSWPSTQFAFWKLGANYLHFLIFKFLQSQSTKCCWLNSYCHLLNAPEVLSLGLGRPVGQTDLTLRLILLSCLSLTTLTVGLKDHSSMLTTTMTRLRKWMWIYTGEALNDFIDNLRIGLFLLLNNILWNVHRLERSVLNILDLGVSP